MKCLILSCSTGDGHNSAARALIEAAGRHDIEVLMRDPVSFGGERARKAVADVYNNMIRLTPKLFGAVYRIGGLYEHTGLVSPVYYANSLYAEKLLGFLEDEKIDAVISTHLYGLEAMTAVNRLSSRHILSCGVLTDYTLIPFFGEPSCDMCFLPHPDLADEAVGKGIPRDALVATGIPVSAGFGADITRAEARQKLGIPEQERVVLFMSGGVGCGNMTALCAFIEHRLEAQDRVYVLTGRNKAMREQIDRRFAGERIRAVPFTTDVPLYMKAADVMASKAGGLTSTEAAAAQIPLVHLLTIPGCETKNAQFFDARGMARRSKNQKDAVRLVLELLNDRDAAERMRAAQRKNIRPDAADRVIEYVHARCL